MATDAFFRTARIFNELDLFQRDPGWLAAFPDRSDETTVPRGEIYVSIVRDRRAAPNNGQLERHDERVLWSVHADQWVVEDENHPAVPRIAPAEVLAVCIQADPSSTAMGVESEPGPEDGVVAFYTWAELNLTPQSARELLRTLCDKFAKAFPDRDDI